MILSTKIKPFIFPLLLIITIAFTSYAFSWFYYKFRLTNYGLVTQATVEKVSSYKRKNSKFYQFTATFTDTDNHTYLTQTIETKLSVKAGEQLSIVYDKYTPQRADLENNRLTNNNIIMYGIGIFILLLVTVHSYYYYKTE